MRAIPAGLLVLVLVVLLSACDKPQPIRIGFISGLSGRAADLGVAGRNAVLLAIEQRNAAGGINGRLIELVIRDHGYNTAEAQEAVAELIAQDIELIIGPMTSSMAVAMLPQINASRSILLGTTVTTKMLTGKDDNFLRVIADTSTYASKSARYQYESRGSRTVSVIYDKNNAAYSESWLDDFRKTFLELGGEIKKVQAFDSGQNPSFFPIVEDLLQSQPDCLVVIGNSVDSALISQQVRKIDPNLQIALAEWASTERYIELAGPAAEGVVVSQFLDRNDQSTRYQNFLAAYQQRFQQTPGFGGLAGYDAALIAIEAHARRKPRQSLKETILTQGEFHGTQQVLHIDRFGDADRATFITVIRNGIYSTEE